MQEAAATKRIPEAALADAKRRVPLSRIVGAAVALKKAGNRWVGLCPFHKENTPSFHVVDGQGFYHCFGCGAHGDAIAFLSNTKGLSFQDAFAELSGASVESTVSRFERQFREASAEWRDAGGRTTDPTTEERARAAEARSIWGNRRPLAGTLAEHYLREVRRIDPPYPPTLGFAPGLFFKPAKREMPALMAALQDSRGGVCSIQRIFLDPSTGGKAQPAKEAKRTKGPMRDGAVRLGRAGRLLGIAGSVEDALSAMRLFLLPVWSTCGEGRLGSLVLPEIVEEVIIFADGDDAGMRLAIAAADTYEATGLTVSIEKPPIEKDWNAHLQVKRLAGA